MSTEFIDFALSHGIDIDTRQFYPSDKIKRCGTISKPKSNNAAYFWDGERGWVQDWGHGASVIWFKSDKKFTDEEKRKYALRRKIINDEQNKKYELSAQLAENTLKKAKLENHPYLEYKGFKTEKGLVLDECLYIPMRNVSTNQLQGFQMIFWDAREHKYQKKMMPGMKAKNAVYSMGGMSKETWLVEGYATGLSVRQALKNMHIDARVVVAFSASNLVNVAPQIQGNKFIFADNDKSQTGEIAAQACKLPYTMADDVGMDANDLHIRSGLFSVVKKIVTLRAQNLK